jgi:hypothetical protein
MVFPIEFDFLVYGELIEENDECVVVDWWGGSKLNIEKIFLVGDWNSLKIGDWFKSKVFIEDGICKAEFLEKNDPPRYMTEEEISCSYSRIKAADLKPVDD